MSKTIISALVVISIITSCKNPSKKEVSSTNSQTVELFNNAIKLKDYVTATVAANQILLEDSSRTDLYDTLAKYYIYNQNAIGARIMTEKALKVNANNYKMLENAAVFDQMDGNFEIAQTKLQKCYEATKQSKYQYKLAENYAQMTQYKSSDSMLNLILAQDSSKNMMMEEA
ncbi:MAG: hypothetical protein H7321_09940, partial [Bacteroidia bacterium]|nr:hypothetical protein [Bacteroidia bacterium]